MGHKPFKRAMAQKGLMANQTIELVKDRVKIR